MRIFLQIERASSQNDIVFVFSRGQFTFFHFILIRIIQHSRVFTSIKVIVHIYWFMKVVIPSVFAFPQAFKLCLPYSNHPWCPEQCSRVVCTLWYSLQAQVSSEGMSLWLMRVLFLYINIFLHLLPLENHFIYSAAVWWGNVCAACTLIPGCIYIFILFLALSSPVKIPVQKARDCWRRFSWLFLPSMSMPTNQTARWAKVLNVAFL